MLCTSSVAYQSRQRLSRRQPEQQVRDGRRSTVEVRYIEWLPTGSDLGGGETRRNKLEW